MNKHDVLGFEICNSSLLLEKGPPQKVVICSQESSGVLSLARNRCMTSRLAKNRGVSTVDDYMKTNQKWWNEVAQVHAQGDAYLLKEFKAGMNELYPLDLEEWGMLPERNSCTRNAISAWIPSPGRA